MTSFKKLDSWCIRNRQCENKESQKNPMTTQVLHFCGFGPAHGYLWCLSYQHMLPLDFHIKISKYLNHPHQCLSGYKHTNNGALKFKSVPKNVTEIPWVVFKGERCSYFKPRGKLELGSHAIALTQVLFHFTWNFQQAILLKPWYLRFDFKKKSHYS